MNGDKLMPGGEFRSGDISELPELPGLRKELIKMTDNIKPQLLWTAAEGLKAAFDPTPKKEGDAGIDLPVWLPAEHKMEVYPGQFLSVPTGVKVKIPDGYWGLLKARSSAHFKKRLLVIDGVIDSGYTGELFSMVFNPTRDIITVHHLERITQLILVQLGSAKAQFVEELPKTERGASGFGSSGGLKVGGQ